MENYVTLQGRGGIVNMYHYLFDTLDSLEGSLDKMLAALYQNLHADIIRNETALYQLS